METESQLNPDAEKTQIQSVTAKSSIPLIAGIILIVAGVLSVIFWASFFSLDAATLEKTVDISQFKQLDPDITAETVLGFLRTCAIIGGIIAVFPVLGGILAIKRKLWGISLASSIIGLFSLGIVFSSSLLSFIAMILLIISRKEFQQSNSKI